MIDLVALIISCIETINEISEDKHWTLLTPDTGIMDHDHGQVMDSMDFVRLVILVEDGIFKQTGKVVKLLTSGRVFTRGDNPFRTIGTMAEYIGGLL
jgi:hypothetical protein